ncbi:MAG: NADH:ubiquinone reductase (Na(+)-transporting) subunit C [Candidatus Omnitrophica bacterium]|nr:NADH:ubiquinone reductase (Na(+)-transporting) subunit C [Candidatus Omnitrophota bacterium]MCB9747132.1 NADH:ubiquinone reductase (Na(+)-transporting) subunit C [Candidatus Omnitrophota bacterium]
MGKDFNKESSSYIFTFAMIICVVCSFSLALVSQGLKAKKETNIALDIKKNILKAVNLEEHLALKASATEIEAAYENKIEELVIDPSGNIVEGKSPKDIVEGESLYPVYVYKEGSQKKAYCFPIVGKGLWSTLYGYLALEPDAMTVRGITYYDHGETPGLGAEIEKDWFQNNFKGKKIWDLKENKLHPVAVVKGKVADKYSGENAQFYVDGISGATMTSKGVTEMIARELNKYEPFFQKIRK